MILGWAYPERAKHLQDLAKTTTGHTHPVRFQGKLQHMQIYSAPLDLPKYRLKNGRTAAAQIEYLATHPKAPKDLFEKDPESDEAQHAQHQLLKGMVHESGLFEYFEKNEQELPLILTNTGFIVNGNRRVCAMRELFWGAPDKYERFKNIDVVILPPADEGAIDWLEGKEQIHKDITADYSWVSTAVMYRIRMQEHNYSAAYVAKLYEIKKSEVEEMLDMLAHAEEYLRDRGIEGKYSKVAEKEYAFRQLRKYRAKLSGEAKKEVFDQISYSLMEQPEGDRLYKSIADVEKYFDPIVDTLRADFDVQKEANTSSSKTKLLGSSSPSLVGGVLNLLNDSAKRKEVRETIRDVIASENEKNREHQRKNYVYAQTRKAEGALKEAASALNKEASKDGIEDLLKNIEQSIAAIRSWVRKKD